jgi:hypothetical protein
VNAALIVDEIAKHFELGFVEKPFHA